ncbi:hypothetical protein D3C80_1083340 [compost metagenome]
MVTPPIVTGSASRPKRGSLYSFNLFTNVLAKYRKSALPVVICRNIGFWFSAWALLNVGTAALSLLLEINPSGEVIASVTVFCANERLA